MDKEILARSARLDIPTEQEEAHDQLLEAAKSALKWLEDFDEHTPEGMHFGGEAKLRKQLRRAIKRQRV